MTRLVVTVSKNQLLNMANNTNDDFNQALPAPTDDAFDQGTAPIDNSAPQQPQASPEPEVASINVINPEGKLVSISHSQLGQALNSGYNVATPDEIANGARQEKYGSLGQEALATLEGAGEGATFGLSAGLERAAGVAPEDILGRAQVNPGLHNLGQLAGVAGSALIPGVGEANLMEQGGARLAEAAGLGQAGGSFLSQVGADTVKAAFGAALMQGGEEVSRAFAEDPNQSAESAIADIGLASVLGGIFGGTVGAALRKFNPTPISAPGGVTAVEGVAPETGEARTVAPSFVSEVDKTKIDNGDFKTSIENSNIIPDNQKKSIIEGLAEKKPDAPEIEAAAKRLGAPVMEGMTSNSKVVQKAEDSLINGAPTYSGLKRQEMYTNGYNTARGAVDQALGSGSELSKAELGNNLKQSITSQIKEQSQPIADMYNYIKQFHKIIPLQEDAIPKLSAEIESIPELRLSPSSPGAKLANDVFNEIGNIKTVDDIKNYRSSIYDRLPATASPGEKRVAAILSDKLKQLEDNSVESFAKSIPTNDEAQSVVSSLVDQRKAADAAYKPFIQKVGTLSEQLGKGKVYGAQDAINFINDLTPEQVTQRLFSKNNSEFLKFFSKEFPNQMEMMKAYQKGLIREAASRTGELSPKLVFNQVNKLEPEIAQSIFNKDELSKLTDAETYLRSFPKNFNPSGTSGMSAFRAFFEHPTGAAIGNVRDFAIEKFIKAVSASPEVKNATVLAKSTVSGFSTATKAIKAIMTPDKFTLPASLVASTAARDKLKKLVSEYTENPSKMMDMNANNPVPQYNTAFSAASARAVQYLANLRPNTARQSPLDQKQAPSSFDNAQYNRALDTAQNPLMVLKHIHQGTLTPQDIATMKTIYPSLYNQLSKQMLNEANRVLSKGGMIPYQQRMMLSMFTGQALDSTMLPQSIIAAQPQPAQPQAPQPLTKPKRGTASLSKASNQFLTPGQAAEQDQAKR